MERVGTGLINNQVMQIKEGNQKPGISDVPQKNTGARSFGNVLNAALNRATTDDPVLKKAPSQPVSSTERKAIRDILSGLGNTI